MKQTHLHSWRWRMKTLLTYFNNRREEPILKWNVDLTLRRASTPFFFSCCNCLLLFLLISFFFSPILLVSTSGFSQHKKTGAFFHWGPNLSIEMQGHLKK